MVARFRAASDETSTWSREDLDNALRRLGLAARFTLIALVVASLAMPLARPNVEGIRAGTERPYGLIPLGFVGVGALLWVLRRPWPVARRLDAGFAFLIFCSLCSGLFSHWLPYAPADVARGFSPSALLGLCFAMLIPGPPGRTTAALIVSALMDPLALGITIARGNPPPSPTMWLWLFLPTAGATGVAILAARLMHQLGRALAESRALGSYRLIERLGQGGMGEVWRAEHATLARPAAVKFIRPSQLDGVDREHADRLRRRFEREAKAVASLRSPHTVDVYDFGVADDGTFYLVMELLDGVDGSALVAAEGPQPPSRVIHLLVQACHSLAEAHRAGVVHRDIKPANLFVCRRGLDRDVLKVLDFGLVQVEDGGSTMLTAQDAISGTPAFIAPEQAQGGTVDGRADLYALGCAAFFLLCGRPPFRAESNLAVLFAHVNQPALAPSTFRPDLPAELDDAVLWCLQKDPANRPPTAEALAARLRSLPLPAWVPAERPASGERGPVDLPSTLDVVRG